MIARQNGNEGALAALLARVRNQAPAPAAPSTLAQLLQSVAPSQLAGQQLPPDSGPRDSQGVPLSMYTGGPGNVYSGPTYTAAQMPQLGTPDRFSDIAIPSYTPPEPMYGGPQYLGPNGQVINGTPPAGPPAGFLNEDGSVNQTRSVDGEYFLVNGQWVSKDGNPYQAPTPGAPSAWASQRGYGDLERRITLGQSTPQDIAIMGQISSVAPSAGPQAMWNDFVARIQDREAGNGGLFGIKELSGLKDALALTPAGLMAPAVNAIPAITPAQQITQAAGGTNMDLARIAAGAGALAGPSASPAPSPTTPTLQSILDSTPPPPSISQGVSVAQAGGELPQITLPSAANAPAVDLTNSVSAIENAAPGSISKGLSDAALVGSPFEAALPAATGAAAGATLADTLKTATTATAENTAGNLNSTLDALGNPGVPNSGEGLPTPGFDLSNAVGNAAAGATGSIGGTKLKDILSGDVGLGDLASGATLGDLGRILGTGAATIGSVAADKQRADALRELSDKYMALGAPSRARYEASFAPGFKPTDIPGFQGALDTSADTILRRMSTSGNPFGNPGGLTQAMDYLAGNLGLPAINQYRNQNAATGGFGAFSTAAPGAATGSIGATGDIYSDIGRGAGDILNPPTDLAKLLRQYGGGASRSGAGLI